MYIEIKDVSKMIKGKQVLDHVSLNLGAGHIHGIVGANGSGKTMLFRALCGFIRLDAGSVTIDGQPVKFNEPLPVNIGVIIETPGFVASQTVWQNLQYLARLKGQFNAELGGDLLKRFGIDQYKDKKVKALSLGTRQKIGIIQAVMEEQTLLILDEPTNGLDKRSVQEFVNLMDELKRQGKTILLASHNEYEMYELADTITEIADGRIAG